MYRLFLRIILAVLFSLFLSACNLRGEVNVLQTLFTVLGIVFSISMSLLVSFDLSKVLNISARKKIREAIEYTRKCLMRDFAISSILFGMGMFMPSLSFRIYKGFSFYAVLVAICVVAVSLAYEVYNFNKIHNLHIDIEESILSEDTSK